ncbi:YozQ family protein [Peribacillus sp. NJ4]|uniref:YozQ family protein n=1 Tax=unclassified Peribacillus TaxID=2675266 RepID=UPI00259FE5C3|nr:MULTISPECIES: YozQ family protein [unclassified Peribacillus]MDM5212822.1 YozQ family protein [Peribacillus sp. NJ4]MDM5223213.1 YozQ family protein [Peribacillus sp. NJ11]
MDSKQSKNESSEIAGRTYDASDYKREDTLSSGLATTHEQVSDTYAEGEIKAVIDDVNGKDIEIKKEGSEEERK